MPLVTSAGLILHAQQPFITSTNLITANWYTGFDSPAPLIQTVGNTTYITGTASALNAVRVLTNTCTNSATVYWQQTAYTGTTAIGGYWDTAVPNYTPEQLAQREKSNKENERKRLHAVHRAKSSIKRALKLMDNIGFGNDIRVFLGGDDIEVSHPASMFKFLLTKQRNSLIHKTMNPGHSTPYSLQLYTKTDVHVANLCVILEDTPLLDQILAVSMFIRTGDEDYILERANWSCITDDEDTLLQIAVDRPNLVNRLRHKRFQNTDIQDIYQSILHC